MTPEEFRQQYDITQDRLGNTLQSLVTLSVQFNILVDQVIEDYSGMTQVVAAFLNERENGQADENPSNNN